MINLKQEVEKFQKNKEIFESNKEVLQELSTNDIGMDTGQGSGKSKCESE